MWRNCTSFWSSAHHFVLDRTISWCFRNHIRYSLTNLGVNLAQSINIHAAPVLCLLVDFVFNTLSYNVRRFIFIVFASLLYLAMNAVYTLTYQPIYSSVTWKSLTSYILVIVALAVIYIVFLIGSIVFCCCKSRALKNEDKTMKKI